MPPTKQSKELGRLVRAGREERELSLRQVAEQVEGADAPYLLRLERGEYRQPHPAILQGLSTALTIPLTDLYSLAGYTTAQDMPSLPVFLRSTLDLPKNKIAEIETYIKRIEDESKAPKPRRKGGSGGRTRR